jgi:multicomponent Na+:H+ antiporter subunit E
MLDTVGVRKGGSPLVGNGEQRSFKPRNSAYLFVVLFAIWLAVTSSLQWQEVATGLVVSLVLSLFLGHAYTGLGLPPISPKRVSFFVAYLGILLAEIIKANLDVAYRVLHPRLPITPGIVAIRTELKQDIAKTLLANSITLTPGTFTLDVIGDTLLIHWIVVRSEAPEEASRAIAGRFERFLKVVFS